MTVVDLGVLRETEVKFYSCCKTFTPDSENSKHSDHLRAPSPFLRATPTT